MLSRLKKIESHSLRRACAPNKCSTTAFAVSNLLPSALRKNAFCYSCSSRLIQYRTREKQLPTYGRAYVFKMTVSEDPLTRRVRDELAVDGIDLDELLNAGKVVNLTRKLETLYLESQQLAAGSLELKQMQAKLDQIESDLIREKRQVMQSWLKRLFLIQAIVFIVVGGMLANDVVPGGIAVPLVGRALGFWTIWLFTIPALRARKGTSKAEKSALNVAFLAMPLMNVALPTVTKDFGTIWAADVVLLTACYLFYGIRSVIAGENKDMQSGGGKEQGRVKGLLKYLDWGSWR